MMQKVKNFLCEIGGLFKSNTAHMVTVAVASLLLGALLFGGSGGNSVEEPSKEQQNVVTEQQNQIEEPEAQNDITQNNNDVLGDYDVSIVSHRVTKNFDDSPVIIVKYAFTNNSDEAASFDWTIEDHLYQNGIELTETIIVDDNYNTELSYSEIKPGVTLELEKAYSMRDTASQITVELSKLISFTDDVLTYTIDLQ